MDEKQKRLNEDLKRFKLLMEYDFYINDEEEEVIAPEGEIITEEPPEGETLEPEAPEGEEMPADAGAPEGEEAGMGDEIPDGEIPDDASFGDELPEPEAMGEPEEMGEPMPEPEPMEDEVELDVTELVQGTEAARQSADHANQQIGDLLAKFDNLTQSLNKMDAINSKIDDIEHEIETRNPTPEEKLEMRSMDSFPYNLKLTDYWSEKEGHYDAMKNDTDENKKQEFILTQDEVDEDYNQIHIKDSFNGEKDEHEPITY